MHHLIGTDRQAMLRHLWRYGEYMEAWAVVPPFRRKNIRMTRLEGYWYGQEHTVMHNAAGEFPSTFFYLSHLPKWLKDRVLTNASSIC